MCTGAQNSSDGRKPATPWWLTWIQICRSSTRTMTSSLSTSPLESPQLPCTDTKEVGVKQCCWKQSPEDRFPSWFANKCSFRCRLERLILVMKIGSVFSGTKGNSRKVCSTCEFNLQECKVPFPANNTSSSSPGVKA